MKNLPNSSDNPLEVTWNDIAACGYDRIANLFNMVFASEYSKQREAGAFDQYDDNHLDFLKSRQEEVFRALKKTSCGAGPDMIDRGPGKLLQGLANGSRSM